MKYYQMIVVVWMFLLLLRPADSGAVSQPVISIVGPKDYGVFLKCDSGGWYPEPEMIWMDSDGTVLPADGPTETDSDGRYTVRGHVTVQKTDNNWFTCRVLQQQINHMMETHIHVPDGVFPRPVMNPSVVAGGFILVGAVIGVLATFVFFKRKLAKRRFCQSV